MGKKPILISQVFLVELTAPNLRRLYDALEDEERYYDMTVSKSRNRKNDHTPCSASRRKTVFL